MMFTTATQISDELEMRMRSISKANGYETDVGVGPRGVMLGRRRVDDDQVPCIAIVEGLDTPKHAPGRNTPTVQIDQTYVLVAYHKCDPDNPNRVAHLLIKDLKRAIFGDGLTLGDKVRNVEYRGRDIGPRADGVGIVTATIEIVVSYTENLQAP